MQTISVRQANQNFSRYVAAVERGEEFVIAKRGRPVAMLALPKAAGQERIYSEKVLQAKQWLEQLHFKGVHGPFTEEDLYD